MKLTMYQVDAFASRVFTGNPAAVCPLAAWLPDALMQSIAEENNLAETAFFVPVPGSHQYHLRWFTPANEVDLCGHATLASAWVLFEKLGYAQTDILFQTRSGLLRVQRQGSALRMSFPALAPEPCETPAALTAGLGQEPLSTLRAIDYIAVFGSEAEVRAIVPDQAALRKLALRGVIVTAPGAEASDPADEVDFVSRFFAPHCGLAEDPVTGSAHCELVPYWAARLGRTHLRARQVSARGGSLTCELQDGQVVMLGEAVHYMTAEITVPDQLDCDQLD